LKAIALSNYGSHQTVKIRDFSNSPNSQIFFPGNPFPGDKKSKEKGHKKAPVMKQGPEF